MSWSLAQKWDLEVGEAHEGVGLVGWAPLNQTTRINHRPSVFNLSFVTNPYRMSSRSRLLDGRGPAPSHFHLRV